MPGPRSTAMISKPDAFPEHRGCTISWPSVACLNRFVAASVTIRATFPISPSLKPASVANPDARRRASAARLWSATETATLEPVKLASPPGEMYPCALARAGLDGKVVRKPASAAETKSQTTAGRETVPQCPLNIRNSWSLVLEDQSQTTPVLVVQGFDAQGATAAMQNRITGQLAS